ncbi:MAG: hypothetical protein LKJ47_00135 [Bifidobacteriaceae bacterium]|jgi:hypothetical protein|nr:hypothetical protein [Bifidobacteriaceae bacterium]
MAPASAPPQRAASLFDTAKTFFALSSAIRVNTIIYAIKQIPLIKRLLPSTLYASHGVKTLARILAVISEPIRIFGTKLLYYGFLAFAALVHGIVFDSRFDEVSAPSALLCFLLLSLSGALFDSYLFTDAAALLPAITLMRMDAKATMIGQYLYKVTTTIVGALPWALLLGILGGLPWWLCLLIPLVPVGVKSIVTAITVIHFTRSGDFVQQIKLLGKATIPVAVILLIASYVLPLFTWVPPESITLGILGALVVFGAVTFTVPLRLDSQTFQQMAKAFMTEIRTGIAQTQKGAAQVAVSRKAIALESQEGAKAQTIGRNGTPRQHGLAYLNALFVRRHRKILWRSEVRFTAICGVIVLALIIFAVLLRGGFLGAAAASSTSVLRGIGGAFSSVFIIMYFVNRGTNFTQALFMNCDHSLLTYSFFKQPSMILKLFFLRLRTIIVVNLPVAIVVGIGFSVLLYVENPSRSPLDYALAIGVTVLLSMFFSVHYMAMYYLIQPYNSASQMKSGLYGVVSVVTYFACYEMIQVQLPLYVLGPLSLAFCVVYCAIAGVLVYKFAPRTFRVRA